MTFFTNLLYIAFIIVILILIIIRYNNRAESFISEGNENSFIF